MLSLDPLWRSFLNYVHSNGGWRGPAPSWDTDESVDEAGGYDREFRTIAENDMRTMETLTMGEIDDGEAYFEQPWNNEAE